VIVKRPPCLVAGRPGQTDQTHGVVNDDCCNRKHTAVLIARDHGRGSRLFEKRGVIAQQSIKLRIGQRVPFAAQHVRDIVDGTTRVARNVTPDAGGRRSSQVRPQRLATAPAQVFLVVLREEQYPSAKPVPGQNP
jgi:hypothetical protein